MKTIQSTLRNCVLGAGTLVLTGLAGTLLGSSPASAQTKVKVAVTPIPVPTARPPIIPRPTPRPTTPAVRPPITAPPVTKPPVTTPPAIITNPGGAYIIPENGVIYNPYSPYDYGGVAGPPGGQAGEVNPNPDNAGAAAGAQGAGNPKTSVPTGNLTGRPIRVRSFPTQPAGTQRLLNNSNLPIVTGIVQTTPTRGVFTLLIGNQQVRIVQSKPAPQTLSKGDMVQVQGVRRGNVLRAGSISILRDR